MAFLNPWLLLGLAGVASPIIIHLLAKKRIQRVVWAAMRFLRVTVDRQQRRVTLEDLLLLLLRCLILVFLALALARPTLRHGGLGLLGGGETALILLDVSGSMSTTDGAESRQEKARRAAEQIIDSLPSGSSVGVWLINDQINDVIPEPTHDLALARKAVREAKRTDQPNAWEPALRRALEVLSKETGTAKHLYLVTDLQAAGWPEAIEVHRLLSTAKGDVQARLIGVTDDERRNLGLSDLRLASALAPVNQPLRFEARVVNHGPEEVRNVAVSLSINGGEPQDEQTIESIPAGGAPKSISLYATVREPGFHTVTARLRADRSPFDDHRTFALRVIDEINVLLVDGDPGAEPRDSEVFYLRNALTPVPAELRSQYFVKTKTIAPSELDTVTWGDFEVIALANVVDVSPAATAALEQFVRAGGGLLVFPGNRLSLPFYNDQLFRARSLLPAAFGPARGDLPPEGSPERPKTAFALQAKDYTHRITEPWRDPRSGTLGSAQFYRALHLLPPDPRTIPKESAPPSVILNFADGTPAIMERPVGLGRVVQFASTADASWNDLPVRPLFVPLIHRTLGYLLARQEEQINLRTGGTLTYRVPAELTGTEVTFVPPGAKRETSRPERIERKNDTLALHFSDTHWSGSYEAYFAENRHPPLRFAATIDPAESNLTELTGSDLQIIGDIAPLLRWTPTSNLRHRLTQERTGTELWFPLAVIALLLAVTETILSNRWSRSR